MEHPVELTFDVVATYNAFWSLAGTLTDDSHWILTARNGLRGMFGRILAVNDNYLKLHQYQEKAPQNGNPNEWAVYCESYASIIFFGMDSALENFIYVMNAFGYLKSPTDFCDIADASSLRQIGPSNIAGGDPRKRKAGYKKYFPKVVSHWEEHAALIALIVEHHDVSKHRCATVTGGRPGALSLRNTPKQPGSTMSSTEYTLESMAHDFQMFLDGLLGIAFLEVCASFGLEATKRSL